ncbi:MAG: hypothetical protein M1831_006172 [Alyxoria varia]|nr:MAG: hypothetical protein M1831_006172 [Alyxoria varia]
MSARSRGGKDSMYGLLRGRRSRQDLKEFFKDPSGSAKHSTEKENGLDPRASSGSSSKLEPPESLTLRSDALGASSFALDDGISQYLSSSTGPDTPKKPSLEIKKPPMGDKKTPEASKDATEASKRTSMFATDSMRLHWNIETTPAVTGIKKEQIKHLEPVSAIKDGSPKSASKDPLESREESARNARKVIQQLREDVMREMREKESLLSRFETLSARNAAFESRMSSQRVHTPKVDEDGQKRSEADRLHIEKLERENVEVLEDRDRLNDRLAKLRAQIENQEKIISKFGEPRMNGEPKESSSPNTREASAIDDELKSGMDDLATEIQDWITQHFRRTKLDLSDLSPAFEEVVVWTVGRRKAVAGIAKIGFFQALSSACLLEIFQDIFFFGLPDAEEYASLRSACRFLKDTAPTNEFNQWRSMTVNMLRERRDDRIEESTSEASNTIARKIDGLLCSVTDAQGNSGRLSELSGIVLKVVDLARKFTAQPATYECTAPHSQSNEAVDFDEDTMEDIKPDESARFLKTVQLVTFPAVIKINGAVGGDEHRKCVVRAKVLCESKSSL